MVLGEGGGRGEMTVGGMLGSWDGGWGGCNWVVVGVVDGAAGGGTLVADVLDTPGTSRVTR